MPDKKWYVLDFNNRLVPANDTQIAAGEILRRNEGILQSDGKIAISVQDSKGGVFKAKFDRPTEKDSVISTRYTTNVEMKHDKIWYVSFNGSQWMPANVNQIAAVNKLWTREGILQSDGKIAISVPHSSGGMFEVKFDEPKQDNFGIYYTRYATKEVEMKYALPNTIAHMNRFASNPFRGGNLKYRKNKISLKLHNRSRTRYRSQRYRKNKHF